MASIMMCLMTAAMKVGHEVDVWVALLETTIHIVQKGFSQLIVNGDFQAPVGSLAGEATSLALTAFLPQACFTKLDKRDDQEKKMANEKKNT